MDHFYQNKSLLIFTPTKVLLLGSFYNTVYIDKTENQQIFT